MEKKKSNKKKIILIGLGVAATGLLSYFGWEYYKKRRDEKEEEGDSADIPPPPRQSTFVPDFFKPKGNDEFPLRKGSRGPRVKALQEALIAKHGREILRQWGADGSFQTETIDALRKLNFPVTIDESTYNVIVQTSGVDSKQLARQLYKDAVNKNISGVISSLRKMNSKEDYTAVSNEFKKMSLRGVSHTLVNGLLGSFSDEKQKQQIRLEFTRMGLKYDGSRWSLSGIGGFTVITKEPTIVWRTPKEGAKVPAKMILGTEIAIGKGFTLFENNGKKFIVKTSTIKYL